MADDQDPKLLASAFFELLATAWVPHAIQAAAELRVADALADGPRPANAVADATGADELAMERLLRSLVTIDLLEHDSDGNFGLTPLGSLLRSDVPQSLRSPVLFSAGPNALRSWSQFTECVRTGSTAAKLLDGTDEPFAPYAADPARQATFDAAMAESTRLMAPAIAAGLATVCDLRGVETVADIGGGYGALLVPVLQANPHLHGVVVDRPHCRTGAEKLIAEAGLAERYRFVDANFFGDELPPADVTILKSVIHDWDDDRSISLLQNCSRAMAPAARLVLVEAAVPDRLEPSSAHRRIIGADLRMLIATGGRERTRAEYESLLAAADLRLTDAAPTAAGLDIMVACRSGTPPQS